MCYLNPIGFTSTISYVMRVKLHPEPQTPDLQNPDPIRHYYLSCPQFPFLTSRYFHLSLQRAQVDTTQSPARASHSSMFSSSTSTATLNYISAPVLSSYLAAYLAFSYLSSNPQISDNSVRSINLSLTSVVARQNVIR